MIALLVTGNDPLFADGPGLSRRVAHWPDLVATGDELGRRFRTVLRGLLTTDPGQRWGLRAVREFLRGGRAGGAVEVDGHEADLGRMLRDGVDYLVSSMTPQRPRLWPASTWGEDSDGCNVHHGAAGVLAVLTSVAGDDPQVRAAVRTGADWLVAQLATDRKVLPGLHFGTAGVAWALLDAADLLRDGSLAERAVAAAKSLPADWPSPDVTHGLAGAGFAILEFLRRTGIGNSPIGLVDMPNCWWSGCGSMMTG